jgi:hypothetical protein
LAPHGRTGRRTGTGPFTEDGPDHLYDLQDGLRLVTGRLMRRRQAIRPQWGLRSVPKVIVGTQPTRFAMPSLSWHGRLIQASAQTMGWISPERRGIEWGPSHEH